MRDHTFTNVVGSMPKAIKGIDKMLLLKNEDWEEYNLFARWVWRSKKAKKRIFCATVTMGDINDISFMAEKDILDMLDILHHSVIMARVKLDNGRNWEEFSIDDDSLCEGIERVKGKAIFIWKGELTDCITYYVFWTEPKSLIDAMGFVCSLFSDRATGNIEQKIVDTSLVSIYGEL